VAAARAARRAALKPYRKFSQTRIAADHTEHRDVLSRLICDTVASLDALQGPMPQVHAL